ncbi:MAG: protein kinase [Xanthomonadales bacterium]|nr:protein kinase [Xanthomonadales bacterium]
MAANTPEFSPNELDELLSGVLPEIPGYRVVRLLGRGGMSYVYLGVEESLDRQVAIKVIKPVALQDEVSMQRFEKEARTIAKLQHPCIVGIHAVGRMELGLLYYVMPYLSRGHVGQRDLRNDEPQIIEVLRALLSALDYAHGHGVVHRDVKAENVLFDHTDRPLLTDFGIAISKRDRSRMTGGGKAMGSWGYMAPEQARGEDVDGRADLYALGVLTYEMLCGALPYRNRDTVALALMHAMDPIPQLPEDKAHWQDFINKAMAKTPEQRFSSAQEMMQALDHVSNAADVRKPRKAREWRLPAGLGTATSRFGLMGLAAFALLALVLVGWLWPSSNDDDGATAAVVASTANIEAAPEPLTAGDSSATSPDQATPNPSIEDDAGEAPIKASEDTQAAQATDKEIVEETPALPPGEAALEAASQQIMRRRLTLPAGDNALESLLSAQRLLPRSPRLSDLGERWLAAAQPYVAKALQEGDDGTARSLLDNASRLVDALSMQQSANWRDMSALAPASIRRQLRQAIDNKDRVAFQAARTRAADLGVSTKLLEPEYSARIITIGIGDALQHGSTSMTLVQLPSAEHPGLATMPTAVTRSTYAAFVSATGRPAANCRNRTALLSLKRREWNDPGFRQGGDHPVVCVSVADANAFASWLGKRDGVNYRLPSTVEWRAITATPANPACGAGGIVCASEGTVPAGRSPSFTTGVTSMLGNVREWPSDCAGCRDHPTVGLSWRDGSSSRENDFIDPDHGYDDVGFRLVRDVTLKEVEQR